MITINKAITKIRKYKELKADIIDIDIKIQELEEDMLGITGAGLEERTGKTYKITSSVENQADKHMEKKENLERIKRIRQRQIAKIDNALTVLNEEEFDIITSIHIKGVKWWRLEQEYHKSYRALKYMEEDAIKKMEKYLV